MKRKLFLLFLVLSLPLYAQVAEQQKSTMQMLSNEIHEQLDNLKQQSTNLTEQLLIAEYELAISSKQVETLQMELRELNTCLDNTNLKLIDYSQTLTQYETKLKLKAKTINILFLILTIMIIIKIVLFILKIKLKIEIPYWLNILL